MSPSNSQKTVIVGIDEAGRGALAGPVVAGACLLPEGKIPSFIQDSKALDPEEREEALVWVETHCTWGVGIVEADMIDSDGILTATESAMQQAVKMLAKHVTPTYLLIDGRDKFWFDYPHSSIIGGDVLEPCISAASIVAKVTRDKIMQKHAAQFSHYGFEEHKGYGTPDHFAALTKHGPSPLHRQTYLKNVAAMKTTK